MLTRREIRKIVEYSKMATEAKSLTLGYWGFRGYGAPSRMLLHFVDAKFDDLVYNKPPGLVWKDKKFNLGFDFPNLPYLIDGDFKLTQSIAILRYLGKKYGLAGSTPQEVAELDMFGDVLHDWRSPLYGVFFCLAQMVYSPEHHEFVATASSINFN